MTARSMHWIIHAVRGSVIAWLALFVASIAVAPSAASAYCGQAPCEELQIEALSPPIGSSFVEGQEGPWVMIAPHGREFVHVNVDTSPQTGSDGHTLSDLYRAELGYFSFSESGTDEGVYTSQGPSHYMKPGTYYWQMEAEKFNYSPCCSQVEYQTPIYSFVVTPKPAPPPAVSAQLCEAGTKITQSGFCAPPVQPEAPVPALTLSEASSFVKSFIKRQSHRHAAHVTASCRLTGKQTARCKATWYSALHVTAASSKYMGQFSVDARYEPMTISFTGTRAQVGCLRSYSPKHCASKVHWKS